MKCFYHSADLDGHCSGAVVKFFNPDCELIGINYGDDFPWDDIAPNEKIYMVDFSLQPFGDMVKLWGMCDLVWIDHHISAIKDSKSETYQMSHISGVRKDGIGACLLAWNYFTKNTGLLPDAIYHLAHYDVWDHSHTATLPFQYGMRIFETVPTDDNMIGLWGPLFKYDQELFNKIHDDGKTIIEYESMQNKKYAGVCSFEIEFCGLKFIAMNKQLCNSKSFDSVYDPSVHHGMLSFGYRNKLWNFSLYTDRKDVDLSVIAKKMGGGGHKRAAGFQSTELPFELPLNHK